MDGKKKGGSLKLEMTLWSDLPEKQKLLDLAEEYSEFRQMKNCNVHLNG